MKITVTTVYDVDVEAIARETGYPAGYVLIEILHLLGQQASEDADVNVDGCGEWAKVDSVGTLVALDRQ